MNYIILETYLIILIINDIIVFIEKHRIFTYLYDYYFKITIVMIKQVNEIKKQTEDVFHSNELIIKLFINKLMTLGVRRNHILGLEQQMNYHCYHYIEESIKKTISLNFIKIDEEDNLVNQFSQAYNTWIEILEPV